jgi:hypothetical protein
MVEGGRLDPVPVLEQLRDAVLSRETAPRMPKWGFRLAEDLVMQLQPKPASAVPLGAMERGVRQRTCQFDGLAIMAPGANRGMLNGKKARKEADECYTLKFEVFGVTTEPDWTFRPTCRTWRRGSAPQGCHVLEDRVLAAFQRGYFESLTPASMLSPNCLICGRGLTDPVSLSRWVGPECAGTSSARIPRLFRCEPLFGGQASELRGGLHG